MIMKNAATEEIITYLVFFEAGTASGSGQQHIELAGNLLHMLESEAMGYETGHILFCTAEQVAASALGLEARLKDATIMVRKNSRQKVFILRIGV